MSTLVIELEVRGGSEEPLAQLYRSVFRPAVSAQAGFESVVLLAPEEGSRWMILLSFASEDQRLAWVATDRHQEVWPRVAALCEDVTSTVTNAVD